MGNDQPQGPVQQDPSKKTDGGPALVIGIVLIVVGLWLSAWRLDIIPDFFRIWWGYLRDAGWGLAVVIIGVVIVLWSRSEAKPHMPAQGTRLYRSRGDRWISGVLGGLARYFNVDPTLLRLAFIGLLFLNPGGLILAYVIMAFVVPEEPLEVPTR